MALPKDRNDREYQKFEETSAGLVAVRVTTTGGGGSSAGGSGIVIGVEKGSYTFDASAQTVTISGFGTLSLGQIQQIVNLTDNEIIYSPSLSGSGGSISSNVLSLDYDTTAMSDSDELQIYLQYNNSEDYSTNSQIVSELNPDYSRYTAVEHIVDEANEAAATYRAAFNLEGYQSFSLQWNISGGVTMTVWGSNDPDADTTADTSWEDITTEVTGNASEVDNSGIVSKDQIHYANIMIKRVAADASNASDVFIRKVY